MNSLDTRSATAWDGKALLEGHPLVLVCGADDAFAKPLAVTLYSALSNYRGALRVKVYIINGGIRTTT